MNGRLYGFRAASNPLAQIATLLVVGVVLIGAVMIGAVVLALLLTLAVAGAIAFSVRLWWLRRRLARRTPAHRSGGDLIEAEYTIVAEHDIERRRRPD